jgi:hypothetical protein
MRTHISALLKTLGMSVKFQEDPQAAQQQLLQRVSHRLQQELIQGEVSANQQVFVELLG